MKLIFFLGFLILITGSQAETIYVDVSASGNGSGSTWANALTALDAALTAAQSGDEIWVAAGTYFPTDGMDRTASFVLKNGVALLGGFRGVETMKEQRNTNPRTNGTVLSGDIGVIGNVTDNAYHVVTGVGTDRTAHLSGFTVTLGYADGNGVIGQEEGAGLWLGSVNGNDSGSPTVSDCRFLENSGDLNDFFGGGGAIFGANGSSPRIERCLFENNSSVMSGAAINVFGGTGSAASPEIISCVFVGNVSQGDGGAFKLGNVDTSTAFMELCHFEANSSRAGGALSFSSDLIVNRCSFVKNIATNDGGAIHVSDDANSPNTNQFVSCIFEENRAFNDGGAALLRETPAIFTNCVFAGNSASGEGGAIYNFSEATPTFVNCTFGGNKANDSGGAIRNFFRSTVTLRNCILWDNYIRSANAVPSASVEAANNATTNFENTLAEHFDLSGGSLAILDGTNPDNAPKFAESPISGGTGNLRLLAGSLVLNAGIDGFNTTSLDIAGRQRKVGVIDLGAYEGGYVTFALVSGGGDPLADLDGNGRSDFDDYLGSVQTITKTLMGYSYQYAICQMAADGVPRHEVSDALGGFVPMLLGLDFAKPVYTPSGLGREQITLSLRETGEFNKWFRNVYVTPVTP